MKPPYEPEMAWGNIGPYDLVPDGEDRVYIVDSRLGGEVVDVAESINDAIVAAARQCTWDILLGVY